MTKRGDGPKANHPIPAIKKTLSYLARLCQPSSRLFQHVDKSARSPASGCGRAVYPPDAANRRLHKAELY